MRSQNKVFASKGPVNDCRSEIHPWVVYIKRLKPTYILHLQCCLLLFPGQSIPALPACTQAPVLACYTHTSERPQWCQNIFKLQSKFIYIPFLLIDYLLQYFVTLPHKHEMEGHSYCGMSTGFNPICSPPHQPSLAWKHKVHPHSFPPIPTSLSPSPSIAWHRWCCTHWPLGTHVKTGRNPYLWVPVHVQVLTGMGMGMTKSTWGLPMPITINTADKVIVEL